MPPPWLIGPESNKAIEPSGIFLAIHWLLYKAAHNWAGQIQQPFLDEKNPFGEYPSKPYPAYIGQCIF